MRDSIEIDPFIIDNSKQTIQEVLAEKVTFLTKSKEKNDDEIEI